MPIVIPEREGAEMSEGNSPEVDCLGAKTPSEAVLGGGSAVMAAARDQFCHPYLEKKQIPFNGLKEMCRAKIEIRRDWIKTESGPYRGDFLYRELVYIDGSSAGCERILPEKIKQSASEKPNDKFVEAGGVAKGTFTPIGFEPSELISMRTDILVCAGLAEGYRLHEATGLPVACGVGEPNIRSIVEQIRALNSSIVVAVDNDEAGERAGRRSGVPWICPTSAKDWSDLYQASGLDAVKKEFQKIAESVYEPQDLNIALDLSNASVCNLLDCPPPPRQWLIEELVPSNIVGLLAAAGGTGKSMLALQLAVSIASGVSFFGFPASKRGQVLIMSAEDDREEYHRRLAAVVNELGKDNLHSSGVKAGIRENLFVLDRVGKDNRLTEKRLSAVQKTSLVDQIAGAANSLKCCRLIILDPLSRFDGGEPNDNSDSTRLVEAAESIRRKTGATVLLVHHVNKTSIKDPERGQEAVRGASALVDGVRWVALLSGMSENDAKRNSVPSAEIGSYVQMVIAKSNYGKLQPKVWLKRSNSGVLQLKDLERIKEQGTKARNEEVDRGAISQLQKILEQNGPLPARVIEEQYGGKNKVLGIPQKRLRAAIEKAVKDGFLRKNGGAKIEIATKLLC